MISPPPVHFGFATFSEGETHLDQVPNIHQLHFITIFIITLNLLQTLLGRHGS